MDEPKARVPWKGVCRAVNAIKSTCTFVEIGATWPAVMRGFANSCVAAFSVYTGRKHNYHRQKFLLYLHWSLLFEGFIRW